jgi:Na+-translocating ferredoxin:NAD+ oxidoreductase RnfD subunit
MDREPDPRLLQIGALASLLLYGVVALDFEVAPVPAAAALAAGLASQALCTRLWRLPRFDPRSALTTSLSLALLLRTREPELAVLAAGLAISSKFVLRWRGKHVFNPSCFGIVALLALDQQVWVSAGQWGSAALFGLAVAGLGMPVLHRTARSDVTWAFLGFHALLLGGRACWLGDPWPVALHALQNGALLVFAFFMISDPKTIPDSRPGRLLFAAAVAGLAFFLQHALHRSDALLWSLAAAAPLVPLLDHLLPGARFAWPRATGPTQERNMPILRRRLALPSLVALALLLHGDARAFCGFYVARAGSRLFNRASQVVLVRDGERTVITMANDFQGDPNEFAVVIPVPSFVERGQIHVGDRAVIDHLDAYTSPRLVEYHDPDPCAAPRPMLSLADRAAPAAEKGSEPGERAEGVRIEARYSVGEYDILILSADESRGLARWLLRNGYQLPEGAEPVLRSYLRQGMRFFVARVDVGEQERLGYRYLRPLQVAFESPRFMLPIRLGTLNAQGPQELFVYALTRRGRVETTNYRTQKLPTDVELPIFVKGSFGEFYRALFDEQVRREDMRSVFTEYAWDMAWCDPCAADPLSTQELRGLGVFWLDDGLDDASPGRDVFVTRLHLRYDAERFPADLAFQETSDRSNFQGRYVLRHAYEGASRCAAAEDYRRRVQSRREREARTLASLTGWSLEDVRRRAGLDGAAGGAPEPPWWQRLWGR